MTCNIDPSLRIAVIGLGYVGLPLALVLARHFKVTGFDINPGRIGELSKNIDKNGETSSQELASSLWCLTHQVEEIGDQDIFIVTVPTPVTPENVPDLSLVISASEMVGRLLKKGNIVVFESTVYPGVTEDVCGSVLEKISGLQSGKDFYLGYSPERINPGDQVHTVDKITKVVAGQTEQVTEWLAEIYGRINGGNIFKAKSIKTAEASKVIENAQRDINVAFMNEITQILNAMDVSIHDVLSAARTKWNFLPFRPGLVGGHCIGVDPYYLAHCAESLGHDPQVILSGRRINDGMGTYLASRLMSRMGEDAGRILVLGFTFKENISDIRNTKVADMVQSLKAAGHAVDIYDPHVHSEEIMAHYGLSLLDHIPPEKNRYDAVILSVCHTDFIEQGCQPFSGLVKPGGILYDIHGVWKEMSHPRSYHYLTL